MPIRQATAPRPRRAGFAFAGDNPLQFVPKLAGLRTSLPLLNARAKGSGGILWLPDRDQIVRRLPVMVAASGRLYLSFAAEVVRVAKAATTYIVKSSGASGVESFGERTGVSEVRIGPLLIATDAEGQLWLHFSRHDQRRFISARRLFDGTLSREEIAGRIVLIGSSAAGLQDLRSTLSTPWRLGSRSTPRPSSRSWRGRVCRGRISHLAPNWPSCLRPASCWLCSSAAQAQPPALWSAPASWRP